MAAQPVWSNLTLRTLCTASRTDALQHFITVIKNSQDIQDGAGCFQAAEELSIKEVCSSLLPLLSVQGRSQQIQKSSLRSWAHWNKYPFNQILRRQNWRHRSTPQRWSLGFLWSQSKATLIKKKKQNTCSGLSSNPLHKLGKKMKNILFFYSSFFRIFKRLMCSIALKHTAFFCQLKTRMFLLSVIAVR